jgi:hypothetical protein
MHLGESACPIYGFMKRASGFMKALTPSPDTLPLLAREHCCEKVIPKICQEGPYDHAGR